MLPCNLLQWLSGAVVYIFAHQAKCLWLDSFASGRTQKNQSVLFFVFCFLPNYSPVKQLILVFKYHLYIMFYCPRKDIPLCF